MQASLETRLSEIPHRTYLWLSLTFDEISWSVGTTERKLLRLIKQLPESVNEAYEMLLAKCSQKEEAKRAFHIIPAAKRPLELKEMIVALAIKGNSRSYKDLDLEGDQNRGAYIRNLCGLFVTVVDEKIYLIHQTAKEFLVRQENKDFKPGMWKHSLVPRESHRVLAEICITHLFFGELRDDRLLSQAVDSLSTIVSIPGRFHLESIRLLKALREQAARLSFLSYSANHWAAHFREAGIEEDNKLTKFALDMITADWGMYRMYSGICFALDGFSEHDGIFTSMAHISDSHKYPLNLAAALGLESVTKLLLKNGVKVNTQGCSILPALIIAGQKGHKEIVELLLEAKADVNLQVVHGKNALQAAASTGDEEIVEPLLEAKADDHLQRGMHGNALQAAIYWKHRQREPALIGPWLQELPSDGATFRERVRSQYPEALFERVESLDRTLDRVCVHGKWYEVESSADAPPMR
jgi:Ankyrin repeats (3 copies)